jgi:predicted N-formylglutamate amidohydrolase
MNRAALLSLNDPPPYQVVNTDAATPLLFVCEHAGHLVPDCLHGLGIAETDLLDHIGWDIGAAAVTRRLAAIFGATAVLATYSRLVIDANRPLDHVASIPEESDARAIPTNAGLDANRRRARQEACFWPFHRAVSAQRRRLSELGQQPTLVFVHSFTPSMADGTPRPWEVGILYDRDERLAQPLLRHFRTLLGEKCGDNQPYTGRGGTGFSSEIHAAEPNLPHIMLEIRNDLIREPAGVNLWAARLATALRTCPDVRV